MIEIDQSHIETGRNFVHNEPDRRATLLQSNEVPAAERELVFNGIVEQYSPLFLSIAKKATHSQETAEDIVQETFLKIWAKIGTYKGLGSFEGWLKKINSNTTYDELTKQDRHPELFLDAVTIDELDSILSQQAIVQSEPSKVYEDKESYVKLAELISQSGPEHLYVLQLWVDGFSIDEIAAICDVRSGTIASRMHRARKAAKIVLVNHQQ